MPRWKALPDELDPQLAEFTAQLRRLVDRSGLGIAALADRTGYSKTSWERYLNGRLLAPKGAVVALAEVTGTSPVHLTTLWELAERAWSRSEMRHDMTMEAIRISQARAALGEFGGPTATAAAGPGAGAAGAAAAGPGAGAAGATGVGGAGGVPTVPPQRSGPPVGQFGPPVDFTVPVPQVSPSYAPPSSPSPSPSEGPGSGAGGGRGRRRVLVFLAGAVGTALLVLVAYVLTSYLTGHHKDRKAEPPPSPTTSAPVLPAGVECVGAGCTGKDPEAMGCGGDQADSPARAVVGAVTVEVRYSKTCAAAWARIQGAAPGDSVRLDVGRKKSKKGLVGDADTDAYTPMVAVGSPADAKACATLVSGQRGCTE